jgi:hypothetical protein
VPAFLCYLCCLLLKICLPVILLESACFNLGIRHEESQQIRFEQKATKVTKEVAGHSFVTFVAFC